MASPPPAIAKTETAPASPTTRAVATFRRVPPALWAHRWWVLAAILALGVAAWQGAPLLLGSVVGADRVTRATLIETVVATGNVETPYRATIGSQITGTVSAVDVEEGQRVVAGQKLISLDPTELAADAMQAQGAYAQAQAHMSQLVELTLPTAKDTQRQAQATLLNAQQTYDRAAGLVRTGDETRVVLDAAKAALDVAQAALRAAQVAVYTAAPGGSDYVTGQTQLDQAKAALDTARTRLGYATITAPRTGVLMTRNVERGFVVQPGGALLVLAPDGTTQLQIQIDERDLGKLALQQAAIASADAYPDQTFAAVLVYINPSVDITKASVEVKLNVTDPPAYLRQDMTVSVDIEVARAENALVVPAAAVNGSLSATPWVMVARKGRAVRQAVKLGVQGNTQTQVLDGVTEGELVLPANAAIGAGARVRAVARSAADGGSKR